MFSLLRSLNSVKPIISRTEFFNGLVKRCITTSETKFVCASLNPVLKNHTNLFVPYHVSGSSNLFPSLPNIVQPIKIPQILPEYKNLTVIGPESSSFQETKQIKKTTTPKKKRKRKHPKVARIYIDGSYRNGVGGIGIFWGDNDRFNVSRRIAGQTTCTRAEYEAALVAIKQAKKRRFDMIILYTDSQNLVDAMRMRGKKWEKRRNKRKNTDLIEKIFNAQKKGGVEFRKVRGHSGNYGNDQADKLARAATEIRMEEALTGPDFGTFLYVVFLFCKLKTLLAQKSSADN